MNKDFSSYALEIYRALNSKDTPVEERDALALLTLCLRSFYEEGFKDGLHHERSGQTTYNS